MKKLLLFLLLLSAAIPAYALGDIEINITVNTDNSHDYCGSSTSKQD